MIPVAPSMKHISAFNRIFASTALIFLLALGANFAFAPTLIHAQSAATCSDDIDNDGDGRADWDGVPHKNLPPDPSCVNKNSTERADGNCRDGIDNNGDGKADAADPSCKTGVIEGSLVPCENKCDLASVFSLINNIITFLLKVILFPIMIIMFVYAGVRYITAGSGDAKVKAKSMIKNLIKGVLLILCSWLIVKTVLLAVGYNDTLYFFD